MSTATNLTNEDSTFAEPVEVYFAPGPYSVRRYQLAYVHISSRIHWKLAKGDESKKPLSFLDFRNAYSVCITRLEDGVWNDVDDCVKVDNHNGRPRITVSARALKVHPQVGVYRIKFPDKIRLEIVSNTFEQHKVWLNQIRAQVAPWSLLEQVFKKVANCARFIGVGEFRKFIDGFLDTRVAKKPLSMPMDQVEEKWSETLSKLSKDMGRLITVDDPAINCAEAVETGATVTKQVQSEVGVAITAELTPGTTGMSTVIHLLAHCAQRVSMCADSYLREGTLPIGLGRIVVLLSYVSESLIEIGKPSKGANEIIQNLMFIFKQVVRTIDKVETHLLGQGSQFMEIIRVEELEQNIEELRPLVVTSVLSQKLMKAEKEIEELKMELVTLSKVSKMWSHSEEREIWDDRLIHQRPPVSIFFSGREKELNTLNNILEKWGSASITQYGGVGKTELMTAFADRAEKNSRVLGGVFWVTLDGGVSDAISSLARLAEKLARRRMRKDEQQNANSVIRCLKQGLSERQGRWLLCLDNADDSTLSGVLNEVCRIADGTPRNGGVLVTSRQGRPQIWDRMGNEQRLILQPLSGEEAMVALWRQVRNVTTDVADDDSVMRRVRELETADTDEYRALKELCGNEGACSLGGLPLALVQAGTYIARFECSFVDYLKMFKNAKRIEDMQDIMRNTKDLTSIRDSQRSIWTTWTVNVRKLTAKAYTVLRTMAMLGPSGVGIKIVKGILEGVGTENGKSIDWMFGEVFIQELVYGSSLIFQGVGEGNERRVYEMHQLVRRFILSEIERGSAMWNGLYNLALITVHEILQVELRNEGVSFEELPDVFVTSHDQYVAHTLALVNLHTLPAPGRVIDHGAKLEDIHRYSGLVMEFKGLAEQAIQVWERLLAIFQHQEVANRSRNRIRRLSKMWHGQNREEKRKSRIAEVYNSLGLALMRSGRLNDAASKHEQSLQMQLAIHGPSKPHPDIATSLNNLGTVYERMGKFEKALEKYDESLEMKLAIHGHVRPHPAIATSLNNLGNVYHQMGELKKALEHHEQSLEMYLAIYGHDRPHLAIANSLGNIGNVCQRLGRLDKALEHHAKSLKIYQAIHGLNKPHPDVARALNNIGTVHQRLGNFDNALKMHEQSLKMELAIHGWNKPHLDIASSLGNLGSVYQRLGKPEKALERHEQSLKMKQRIHGLNNPHLDVADSLNNLGLLYASLGMLAKALETHERSLEMYRAIHGPNKPHNTIAASLCNLGSVYQELGKIDAALEKYEQSLKMYEAIHGHKKANADIARVLNNIADLCLSQGNLPRATELFERSVEMLQIVHDAKKSYPEITVTLSNLGCAYHAEGKLRKALETYKKSLEMYREMHGLEKPHADVARCLRSIGIVCYGLRNLNHATESFEQSLQMLRVVHGRDSRDPIIRAVLSNLVIVYESQGKRAEALAMREQITAIDKVSTGAPSDSAGQN